MVEIWWDTSRATQTWTDCTWRVFSLSHCTRRSFPHQLPDVAEGLNYLHSCNLIHGDLKGVRDYSVSLFVTIMIPVQSTVLVDAAGRARITDFGLVMVCQNSELVRSASDEHECSARWIAPEILDGRGTYSKESDVFSFAMVTIEVCSRYPTRVDPIGLTVID